ncbi:hypothetical protein [Paenibacillus tianmuensis]|uniref:hypothetical protein n=1 Tax=Paenibacillus tianmuensis TaxID=624147 RepID=UPI00115F95EE|nr:hypothetical protein [Paenibacillus tianmuensis]
MLTIQVTPQLHHVVHILKHVDLCKYVVNPSLKSLFLSNAEAIAVVKTFDHSANGTKQPKSDWG